jgi:acyl-coenzyme A synthetase/AMP-(fatty) acid ligase
MPKLDDLQFVSISGSPLSKDMYQWFYQTFPGRVGLFSGSGGTDLVGGSMLKLDQRLLLFADVVQLSWAHLRFQCMSVRYRPLALE